MPSLVTVNNNVSLISITVAPSTWLATVIVFFVLVVLYLSRVSLRIPRFNFPKLPTLPSLSLLSTPPRGGIYSLDKPLPARPRRDQFVLADQSLVVASHSPGSNKYTTGSWTPGRDGRSSRRPRRLLTGLRTPSQPDIDASLVSAPQRAGNGGSRGLRHRFSRWVLASGMAEARQRRPEQRLLEAPPVSASARPTAAVC
jgi:hypothetical protein